VRALSFLWHPPSLDELGLATALDKLVAGFCHRLGISCEVAIDRVGEIPYPMAAPLYSLTQTALDGVFHQERPTLIRLRMAAPTDFLHLIIEYDATPVRRHALELSMRTVEEQLAEMGARLSIHQVLRGTFIAASVPHARAAA
jgi:two-component system NarL family sensor kinase